MAKYSKYKEESNPLYLLLMLVLSILALAMLALEKYLIVDQSTNNVLGYADTFLCILFFLDFLITLIRAENKIRYLLMWGWLDIISSIPMISAFRWARAARIIKIFRVLRGMRSARILTTYILSKRAESAFFAAVLVTIIIISFSAISTLYFETVSNSNIKTAEDAIWWAITTITTVGYGDKYPVTTEGRIIGVILMMSGIGLFGIFTGFVAAWFMKPSHEQDENDVSALRNEISELKQIILERGDDGKTLPHL